MKKTIPYQDLVRVIVDTRDARKDRFIERRLAKELYVAGKIDWDQTNSAYCTKENGSTKGLPLK